MNGRNLQGWFTRLDSVSVRDRESEGAITWPSGSNSSRMSRVREHW